MSENKQSAVVSRVEIEQKMIKARLDAETVNKFLLPYIEYRQVTANKYFDSSGILTTDERQAYVDLVEHINNEIKNILGL